MTYPIKIEGEIRRHATKWVPGDFPVVSPKGEHETQQLKSGLSIEGIHEAKNFAQSLVEEVRGTDTEIILLMPSNVGRAREVVEIVVLELQSLLKQNTDIQLVTFKELNKRSMPTSEDTARFIIIPTREQMGEKAAIGSSLIGYRMDESRGSPTQRREAHEDNLANEAWERIKNLLEGDRLKAFQVWLADQKEWEQLMESLKQEFPDANLSTLNPGEMKVAPEEWALRAWKWLTGIHTMMSKKFPEKSAKYIGISHDDVSDFVTYITLGYPLNAATLEHFGTLRNYLEPSRYRWMEDGGLETSYRGETHILTKEEVQQLPTLIESMREKRLNWWKEKKWI